MKHLRINILIIISLIALSSKYSYSQIPDYYFKALNVDSIYMHTNTPVFFLQEVSITPDNNKSRNRSRKKRYNRQERNFLKAYPYAKLISKTMQQIESDISDITDENDREKYIKKREKKFRKTYEKEIRHLTISQGIILIKLIDRETGTTSFEIIKEFRGGVLATTYQTIARIFGNNLKMKYDPINKDNDIENLVIKYKNGEL